MYIKSSLRKEKGITRKIKKLLSMLSFYRKMEVTSLYTTIIPPTEETNDHNYNQCGGKTLVFPFAPFHPIFYYTKNNLSLSFTLIRGYSHSVISANEGNFEVCQLFWTNAFSS